MRSKADSPDRLPWILCGIAFLLVSFYPLLMHAIEKWSGTPAADAGGFFLAAASGLLLLIVAATRLTRRWLLQAALFILVPAIAAAVTWLIPDPMPGRAAGRFGVYVVLSFFFLSALGRKGTFDLGFHLFGIFVCLGGAIVAGFTIWALSGGYPGLDDAGVAVAAGVAGGIFWGGVLHPSREGLRMSTLSWSRILYGVALIFFLGNSLFICLIRVGHKVHEPDIGEFRSKYTRQGLEAERDRREFGGRGRIAGFLPRFLDFYETEASFHLEARDILLAEGDVVKAFKENLIVERFYAPSARAVNRLLPAETSQGLREKAGPLGKSYYYLSGPPFVITWCPRPLAWLLDVIVTLALVLVAETIKIRARG